MTVRPEALRVLVVDDEPSIVDVVSMALRHHGYEVASVDTGAGALAQVRDWRPHAMVLDVMLPDMEGFEVARRLSAQQAQLPILFLSARDNTSDKVRGLTTGGDDYVTKPFSLEELLARLRNILRRSGAHEERSSRLEFADLALDDDTREVSRDGRPIELTATEYRLLRYLLLNPRRVMTRAQLLDHVWSYDFGGDARVLETYISYLRKKLDVGGPPLLHTVRGVGYVLRLPPGVTVSLRARLLVGMVVLVAAGLAAAAIVTYEEQRSFLLDRVDQQVESALVPLSFRLRPPAATGTQGATRPTPQQPPFGRRPGVLGPGSALPPGTFGEVVSPDGHVLRRRTFTYGERTGPQPSFPSHPALTQPGSPPRLFTVSAPPDGARYRAAAFRVGANTALVAVPLREAQLTLHRLVKVEALVAAAVILALVALGWLVIRVGLRPLERIGRVASEIAGGDLSRRVATDDQRTEVGRLGRSLNEMLAQIERAFAARQLSEDRLRRFLADASHELRTPLASIRGYAELFRMGAADDPETLARAMARIESEATRMGVLVEDLLLLAQLDQAPEPRRAPLTLGALLTEAAQDTSVIAPGRAVQVEIEQDATVLGDPDQLGQLLANLTHNAVLHTPPESAIDLRLSRRGGRALLEVRDHGSGVPDDPAEIEQLFDRFWRSEGGRQRGKAGSGLGLAIVRVIARAHGGEVSATNAPGGGALFTVELPLSEPAGGSQENLSLLTSDS